MSTRISDLKSKLKNSASPEARAAYLEAKEMERGFSRGLAAKRTELQRISADLPALKDAASEAGQGRIGSPSDETERREDVAASRLEAAEANIKKLPQEITQCEADMERQVAIVGQLELRLYTVSAV